MNIKSLIGHVINQAISRIVSNAGGTAKIVQGVAGHVSDDLDYEALAGEVDLDYVAGAMSVDEVATALDHEEIAKHVDSEQIAENFDSEDLAGYIDLSDLAYSIDMNDLAEHIDMDGVASEVAEHIDLGDVVEAAEITVQKVAEFIDYAELAKKLSPLESLAATADGPILEEAEKRLNLNGIASKLLETAVDKLLELANRQIEEDLAHSQAEAEAEAKVKEDGNGQSGPVTFVHDPSMTTGS